jgi:hypothetical protein
MSSEQIPAKPTALENGRIPAKLTATIQQCCGRIPADVEGVLENFGRIPSKANAILAKPAQSTVATTQTTVVSQSTAANASGEASLAVTKEVSPKPQDK